MLLIAGLCCIPIGLAECESVTELISIAGLQVFGAGMYISFGAAMIPKAIPSKMWKLEKGDYFIQQYKGGSLIWIGFIGATVGFILPLFYPHLLSEINPGRDIFGGILFLLFSPYLIIRLLLMPHYNIIFELSDDKITFDQTGWVSTINYKDISRAIITARFFLFPMIEIYGDGTLTREYHPITTCRQKSIKSFPPIAGVAYGHVELKEFVRILEEKTQVPVERKGWGINRFLD
ncbi:hypothetical protein GC425_08875 [Corynebacterium sp. zg254]|nr:MULTISPECIES: hypothetical protein [Corynebacterium]MCR5914959.1 hypothetical protein [Corynebacterium sp. zg254]